jgi:hypothetical protein
MLKSLLLLSPASGDKVRRTHKMPRLPSFKYAVDVAARGI